MYLYIYEDKTAQKQEALTPEDVSAVEEGELEIYRFNFGRHRFEHLMIIKDDSGITRIWEEV